MFAVCWAPIHFVFVFKAVGIYTTKVPEDFKLIVFQILSHVLAYVNRYGHGRVRARLLRFCEHLSRKKFLRAGWIIFNLRRGEDIFWGCCLFLFLRRRPFRNDCFRSYQCIFAISVCTGTMYNTKRIFENVVGKFPRQTRTS